MWEEFRQALLEIWGRELPYYEEVPEEELMLENEVTREEDWDIEDTLEDCRFEDPDFLPSWEMNEKYESMD
jgi:hypothetical protein